MIEQWKQWEPIPGLASKYDIDDISDGIKGFKIVLTDIDNTKNQVKVIFKNSVDAYMRIDETFRLKLIYDLDKQYGGEFYGDWTFFKVTNSSYIKWLSEQSYGISDERPFIHFSFIAGNSILDVVTTYEPKVELITSPQILND